MPEKLEEQKILYEVVYKLQTATKPGPPPIECKAGPFTLRISAETFAVNLSSHPMLRGLEIREKVR